MSGHEGDHPVYILTAEQKQMLIELIRSGMGSDLAFQKFADTMLGLFEDIPGFETIPPNKAKRIVKQLWRTYHGKEPH